MIQAVRVENFRSCVDTRLDDGRPMLALVGRNGAGKTSLLRAIAWAASSASGTEPIRPEPDSPAPSVELLVNLHAPVAERGEPQLGSRFRYRISLAGDQLTESAEIEGEPDAWSVLATRVEDRVDLQDPPQALRISATTPMLRAIESLAPTSAAFARVAPLLRFLEGVRYYAYAGEPGANMLSEGALAGWRKDPRRLADPSANAVLFRLLDLFHLQAADPKTQQLASLIGPTGLNLVGAVRPHRFTVELPGVAADAEQRFLALFFDPPAGAQARPISFSQLSGGTRHVLSLLTTMVYDESAVMLVEQPEDGIHPGLLHKLVPLLRAYSQPRQFIVATHAASVLDRLDPDEARLVTMGELGTKVRALEGAERSAVRAFLADEGSFSEFLEGIGA